jgi:hypothetical protein
MRIVEVLAGNSGRWAKAGAGLLLIILGIESSRCVRYQPRGQLCVHGQR